MIAAWRRGAALDGAGRRGAGLGGAIDPNQILPPPSPLLSSLPFYFFYPTHVLPALHHASDPDPTRPDQHPA